MLNISEVNYKIKMDSPNRLKRQVKAPKWLEGCIRGKTINNNNSEVSTNLEMRKSYSYVSLALMKNKLVNLSKRGSACLSGS